jgi:hypothetical protein
LVEFIEDILNTQALLAHLLRMPNREPPRELKARGEVLSLVAVPFNVLGSAHSRGGSHTADGQAWVPDLLENNTQAKACGYRKPSMINNYLGFMRYEEKAHGRTPLQFLG